jgi:hypothetical protein
MIALPASIDDHQLKDAAKCQVDAAARRANPSTTARGMQ